MRGARRIVHCTRSCPSEREMRKAENMHRTKCRNEINLRSCVSICVHRSGKINRYHEYRSETGMKNIHTTHTQSQQEKSRANKWHEVENVESEKNRNIYISYIYMQFRSDEELK